MKDFKPLHNAPIRLKLVRILEVGGIDMTDYPKFTDAHIVKAEYNDLGSIRLLSDEELDNLPKDWVHEQITTYWIH